MSSPTGGTFTQAAADFLSFDGRPRLDQPFEVSDVQALLAGRC